jgi:hypothetical protein
LRVEKFWRGRGAILVCKGIGIQDGLDSHPFLQE